MRSIGSVLVLGVLSSISWAQPPLEQAAGAATPEQAAEDLRQAALDQNWEAFTLALAPRERIKFTLSLVVGSHMALGLMELGPAFSDEAATSGKERSAEEEARMAAKRREIANHEARLRATLVTHDLEDLVDENAPPMDPFERLRDVDHSRVVPDLIAYLAELNPESEWAAAMSDHPLAGPVRSVDRDGAGAKAQIGEQQVELIEIEGRWFAKLPTIRASSSSR